MLTDKSPLYDVYLEKGKVYEVTEVIIDSYKVKVPMKQKG